LVDFRPWFAFSFSEANPEDVRYRVKPLMRELDGQPNIVLNPVALLTGAQ
jgi:hypothetical protein